MKYPVFFVCVGALRHKNLILRLLRLFNQQHTVAVPLLSIIN